ncbi:MAG: hypothetical protein QXP13_01330 [Candidatus Methanomethylicia archaeon]
MLDFYSVMFLTGVLALWNFFVIHYLSKWVYNFFKAHYIHIPAAYIGRKVVHILNGGITTICTALFYEGYYWIVSIAALLIALYIDYRRRTNIMYWFQVEGNRYEVHFAIMFGLILYLGVFLGDVWIGLIGMLFMSFGDAVTGLIRAFRQRRQVKSWDGTIAMFIVCSFIAFFKYGFYGVFMALISSLVERIPKVDDNVMVPLASGFMAYIYNLFPILHV